MGVEDRPSADLPEGDAEKLRIGIESAVMRSLEAGWNAAQVRTEVEYIIETADDELALTPSEPSLSTASTSPPRALS